MEQSSFSRNFNHLEWNNRGTNMEQIGNFDGTESNRAIYNIKTTNTQDKNDGYDPTRDNTRT